MSRFAFASILTICACASSGPYLEKKEFRKSFQPIYRDSLYAEDKVQQYFYVKVLKNNSNRLGFAAYMDKLDLAKELIEQKKANVNTPVKIEDISRSGGEKKRRIIDVSLRGRISKPNEAMTDYLLSQTGLDLTAVSKKHPLPLNTALRGCKLKAAKKIIAKMGDKFLEMIQDQPNPLLVAAQCFHPTYRGEKDKCFQYYPAKCVYQDPWEVIEVLLKKGTSTTTYTTHPEVFGATPLSYAVDNLYAESVRLLLNAGAPVRYKRKDAKGKEVISDLRGRAKESLNDICKYENPCETKSPLAQRAQAIEAMLKEAFAKQTGELVELKPGASKYY